MTVRTTKGPHRSEVPSLAGDQPEEAPRHRHAVAVAIYEPVPRQRTSTVPSTTSKQWWHMYDEGRPFSSASRCNWPQSPGKPSAPPHVEHLAPSSDG